MNVATLKVSDIENIGVGLQQDISDQMSSLIQNTKCLDIGRSGKKLVELSAVTGDVTKKVMKFSPNGVLGKMFTSSKKWLAKFDSVEKAIDNITVAVDVETERLDNILLTLMDSVGVMKTNSERIDEVKADLDDIIKHIQANPADDENGFKLQAATHRLKVMATMGALTQQEVGKTILIIQENKEISNQLKEASSNLVPMFKTMMLNVIAAKSNEDAVQLRKNLVGAANTLVVESAKSIAKTADDLIEGRREALISPKSLEEANKIIQSAITKVLDSTASESTENLKVIRSLEASANQIRQLDKLGE